MRHGQRRNVPRECPIVHAAVIFHPSRVGRVLVKVLWADVMMLAADHQP